MIAGLRGFFDNWLGRGEAAIAVPSFDGALKPNQRLEEAAVVLENVAAEDLATDGSNPLSRGGSGAAAPRRRRGGSDPQV